MWLALTLSYDDLQDAAPALPFFTGLGYRLP